ncbi:MAG: hypothetical protein IH621_07970 [Krumholzibacteria bacterium]|nr:hypothetical protein [Candidatus Krumholzibacteria bacterium]
MRRLLPAVTLAALLALAAAAGCAPDAAIRDDPAAAQVFTWPTDSLRVALAAWIACLERDDGDAACLRWAADDEACAQIAAHWAGARLAHREHDYRRWLAAAHAAGARFTVGGHDTGHVHTVWAPTAAGWRIVAVFRCR